MGDSVDTKIGFKTKNERFRNGSKGLKPASLGDLGYKQQYSFY
jgi:hypothetical protein